MFSKKSQFSVPPDFTMAATVGQKACSNAMHLIVVKASFEPFAIRKVQYTTAMGPSVPPFTNVSGLIRPGVRALAILEVIAIGADIRFSGSIFLEGVAALATLPAIDKITIVAIGSVEALEHTMAVILAVMKLSVVLDLSGDERTKALANAILEIPDIAHVALHPDATAVDLVVVPIAIVTNRLGVHRKRPRGYSATMPLSANPVAIVALRRFLVLGVNAHAVSMSVAVLVTFSDVVAFFIVSLGDLGGGCGAGYGTPKFNVITTLFHGITQPG